MNFYNSAALALDHLSKHQGSVKGSLTAAGIKTTNSGEQKRILALVIETLKFRKAIEDVLAVVPLLSLEKLTFPKKTPPKTPSSLSLIHVLLHDLLFSSKGKIEASDKWPPKQSVLRHQARLKAELVKIQIRQGKQSKFELAAQAETEGQARYIRWNPNTDLHRQGDWSFKALLDHLQSSTVGLKLVEKEVWPIPANTFFLDPHLTDCLLVFPAETKWWINDEWYRCGAVILQDKASCFPARVLMEGWDEAEGTCLDATAAPGNKTSYISALMGDKRSVIGFEKSPVRYETLQQMLTKASCSNVKARNADFLEADPNHSDFKAVSRILLDPSCSGSGIVNRLDYLLNTNSEEETDAQDTRLEKLASFQLQMILHAFKFPAVSRIVYSTCSIHPEEDEHVVAKALSSKEAKSGGWTLAQRKEVLPSWSRRGRKKEMGDHAGLAERIIRCQAGEDKTNGFFVACFVKTDHQGLEEPDRGQKRRRAESEAEEDTAVLSEADEAEDEFQKDVDDSGTKTGSSKEKTDAQRERRKRKKLKQKQKTRT